MSFTAKEWRERTVKARVSAEEMTDAAQRRVMRSIAASHDRLAEMVENPRATLANQQRR
jgi:hypothetical protein